MPATGTNMHKADLDKVPGFSRGVRDTGHSIGLRMLKMVRPICPNSKIQMEKDTMGNWRRIEAGPDAQNCQLEGGQWWRACGDRGHDPYFTTAVWYTTRDITQETDDGAFEVVKTVRDRHEAKRPNLAQVAIAKNINNGRGPDDAIQRKGFKYLGTLGFEECCQYRNCQKEVNTEFVIDGLGRYCSYRHLALVVRAHDDTEPYRVVDPSVHKEHTRKQESKRRREMGTMMNYAKEEYGGTNQ